MCETCLCLKCKKCFQSKKSEKTSLCVKLGKPAALEPLIIRTSLVKSFRGFGFTIVSDDWDVPDLLQIKAIVPHGPAWLDGKLKTGDVLVYINEQCVLGLSYQDAVSLFRSIPPGEIVNLCVARNLKLPFDPKGPSTEIVTTNAVSSYNHVNKPNCVSCCIKGSSESAESMTCSAKPILDITVPQSLRQRNFEHPYKLSTGNNDPSISSPNVNHHVPNKAEFLSEEIVKGKNVIGFTVADSVSGQKVKKIPDRDQCQCLHKGDILIAINHTDICGLHDSKVAQLLKECPCDKSAHITVQRDILPRVAETVNDSYRQPNSIRSNGPYNQPFVHAEAFRPSDTLSHHEHKNLSARTLSRADNLYLSNSMYSQPRSVLNPVMLNFVPKYRDLTVTLHRQKSGFGFQIVGGSENGSQLVIGRISPGGAADLDGRLRAGDEIISVNNQHVLNTSHYYVVQLIKNTTNGKITLGVLRRVSTDC